MYYKNKLSIKEVPLEVYFKYTEGSNYMVTLWKGKHQACIRREVVSDTYFKQAEKITEQEFKQKLAQITDLMNEDRDFSS